MAALMYGNTRSRSRADRCSMQAAAALPKTGSLWWQDDGRALALDAAILFKVKNSKVEN